MREIYLDNSATTKPSAEVIDIVVKTMTEDYGNPSSLHRKGLEAERYMREARAQIAGTLKAKESEIFFTSGGTESNNWAIIGAALAARRRGTHILTTWMEHPAVAEPVRFLEKMGFTCERIPVSKEGLPDLEALQGMLRKDTVLVSAMYVNNEIGSVSPVAKMAEMVHREAPDALFHVDAVQAYSKYRICPSKLGIDLLSASGHKFHGPKGTGFLYIREGARILPIIYGGGQQKGMRSGTDNVPGIAGMGLAAARAYENFDEKISSIRELRRRLEAGLRGLPGVVIHGPSEEELKAPHIVNAAFIGVGSEVLLHVLEESGIYISAGSACSTHKRAASPTLSAISAPPEETTSSVRFSLSEENTGEEIDTVLKTLGEVLPRLRKYRAR